VLATQTLRRLSDSKETLKALLAAPPICPPPCLPDRQTDSKAAMQQQSAGPSIWGLTIQHLHLSAWLSGECYLDSI
jgi:hypothetical protein